MAKANRTQGFEEQCVLRLVPFHGPLIWGGQHQLAPVELLRHQRNEPGCHGMFRQLNPSAIEERGPGFCS